MAATVDPASAATAAAAASPSRGAPALPTTLARLQALGFLPITWGADDSAAAPALAFPAPAALRRAVAQAGGPVPWNPFVLAAMRAARAACGLADAPGWQAKVAACLHSPSAPVPARRWRWVLVSLHRPETLRLWVAPPQPLPQGWTPKSGWTFKSLVNSGVFNSTPLGTFSIGLRFRSTSMVGAFPIPVSARAVKAYDAAVTAGVPLPANARHLEARCGVGAGDPIATSSRDGRTVCMQPYDDSAIPWVNYFDMGIAIHGYPRAHYGFPQSNGCVELPVANAAALYPHLGIGVPVTISR